MKTYFAATLVLTTCAVGLLAGWPAQKEARRLNPQIGPPNPQQYGSIRVAKDWKNPYVVILKNGIEVIANGLRDGRAIVAPADLRRTLIDLPVTAWPYGRVAAVQENGIRAADRSDDQPIAHNLRTTLAILNALQVTVDRWPSA